MQIKDIEPSPNAEVMIWNKLTPVVVGVLVLTYLDPVSKLVAVQVGADEKVPDG